MRVAPNITLSDKEKKRLEKLARSNTASVRLAHRARIMLLAAGLDNKTVKVHPKLTHLPPLFASNIDPRI